MSICQRSMSDAPGYRRSTINFRVPVILSHLHGDHFGGVPFLILDGQFKRRTRPLIVAGPPGVEARVHEAMEVFFPGSTGIERKFDTRFIELADRVPIEVGPARVTGFAARCSVRGRPICVYVSGSVTLRTAVDPIAV